MRRKFTSPQTGHRNFTIFAGDRDWAVHSARQYVSLQTDLIWITDISTGQDCRTVLPDKVSTLLGQETDVLIYDTFTGLNLNALGITTGLVRGGGTIILLTPAFSSWPQWYDPEYQRILGDNFPDRPSCFIKRTIMLVSQYPHIHVVRQEDHTPLSPLPATAMEANPHREPFAAIESEYDHGALTRQQACAIQSITSCFYHKTHRTLTLTASRGRGKTSALGLAAAVLMSENRGISIVVTAPALNTIQPLFRCLCKQLEKRQVAMTYIPGKQLECNNNIIKFVAPDELLHTPCKADILYVDEAASIPVPLLEQWLDHHFCIIFSSTLHGYEGTGRGFALRFMDILQQKRPAYRSYHLTTPVRWAENDPSEHFIFALLGLDSKPASHLEAERAVQGPFRHERHSPLSLIKTPSLLSQVFGLLVLSHYQTQPSDFRQLLDAPGIDIHTLYNPDTLTLLGVALVFKEGPLPEALHTDIFLGKRRKKGNLLPQLLATRNGSRLALGCKSTRIQRIAIHPALHGRGLGSQLLQQVTESVKNSGMDFIGSNFGVTDPLLHFWVKNSFTPVTLGSKKDASSACHAITVLHSLTCKGDQVIKESRQHFVASLPFLLQGPLKTLEPGIIRQLIRAGLPEEFPDISLKNQEIVTAYANGYYLYDSAIHALHQFTLYFLSYSTEVSLTEKKQRLLVMKILQNHSWKECIHSIGYSGKKAAEKELREIFQDILSAIDA